MSTEAPFSVTAKGPNNELVTLRGDSWPEFVGHAIDALGEGVGETFAAETYAAAFVKNTPVLDAVTNIQQAFPQAAPVSNIPGIVSQPVAQPYAVPSAPPMVGDGGVCVHGPRVFKTGPGKGGAVWNRFECPIPYSPATKDSRCRAVNC